MLCPDKVKIATLLTRQKQKESTRKKEFPKRQAAMALVLWFFMSSPVLESVLFQRVTFSAILTALTIHMAMGMKSDQGALPYPSGPMKSGSTDNWFIFFFFLLIVFRYFFIIYFWLRWVFVAARGLSLVVVSRGYSSLRCAGFSLWWLLLLLSTGSRALVAVACGLSCSTACEIFPDQGSNPCPLHWQVDS